MTPGPQGGEWGGERKGVMVTDNSDAVSVDERERERERERISVTDTNDAVSVDERERENFGNRQQ